MAGQSFPPRNPRKRRQQPETTIVHQLPQKEKGVESEIASGGFDDLGMEGRRELGVSRLSLIILGCEC
jgi:hypothetical protein